MHKNTLVTYASRTGSTAEVAKGIARILTEYGLQVNLLPVQDVVDLRYYQAIVAGSAIRNRKWLPEAMEFIHTHRAALGQKPFAMFTLCMTLAMKNGERYRSDVMEWLDPIRRIAEPVSEGLFPGVLDITKIPSLSDRLKFRFSVLLGVWSEGDHRDWNAINAWANELPANLVD